MEAAGAIFLPAAGIREGRTVKKLNVEGYYWANSIFTAQAADALNFMATNIFTWGFANFSNGCSVRLVQEVK